MNKNTGVVRCIDKLGRLVIPKEVRIAYGLGVGEPVEISVENGRIIVEKYKESCLMCGNFDDVVTIDNKKICKSCINKIKDGH